MFEQAIDPLGVLPINALPDNPATAMVTGDLPTLDVGQADLPPTVPPGPK